MTATTREQPLDEARATLGDAMQNSVNYANRAPLCCCDGVETTHEITPPSKTAKRVAVLVLAMVIGGIVLGMCSAGRAAERNQSWDVFAFREGKLLQADARNIVPVESKGPFPTKRLCEDIGIGTVRIRDAGWKLSCRRVD